MDRIKDAILSHGNPVTAEGDMLYNIITGACIPQEHVQEILNADSIGQKLHEDFVSERINGDVRLWAPVKKLNIKTFTSSTKKSTAKLRNTNIDLKETKVLYGRLPVIARSREIDQKGAIGAHEFTKIPRALFASDGEMLPCTDKSNLIHHLKKFVKEHQENAPVDEDEEPRSDVDEQEPVPSQGCPGYRIAIVDGMVLLHKLTKKPSTTETVKDLSQWYYDRLMSLTNSYEEIILSWSDANIHKIVQPRDVHAMLRIYHVRKCANVLVTAKMIQTLELFQILLMTLREMMTLMMPMSRP